jgi:mannose-6-phosphate isomerase
MDWYPLRLTTPFQTYGFGGTAIVERLRKANMPLRRIAETWEVSDVDGFVGTVREGPLAGTTLRQLVTEQPGELMGREWRGERFPLLTKFLDGAGMLPVHLHANDETARRLENEPNGKTEAWHILDAAPGATILAGLGEGVDETTLRDALLREDYDAVMRRLPVRAGDTVYVPGGTLHSFGPDTLIYEIQQTSDIGQDAMPHDIYGKRHDTETWHRNIDTLLQQLEPGFRPIPQAGLRISAGTDHDRIFCCAGPYFALERWRVGGTAPMRHGFETALILSNVGAPVTVRSGGWSGTLGRAETLLLPAALGSVEITGPADILAGYLPDLDKDVVQPLTSAGYTPEVIATLGEVKPE